MAISFIVNPEACRGKALHRWKRFSALLKKEGLRYGEYYTSRPQEAEEIARRIGPGSEMVYAVGGDGTLLEVANGLRGFKIPLGLIPFGTGNDLGRCLGVPRDFEGILQMVKNPRLRKIDAGALNGRVFCNVVGIGFDGEVALSADNILKGMGGTPAYLLGILKALYTYRAPLMEIDIDGKIIEKRTLLVAVGNGQYYGGGLKVLPQAEQDNGLLEICIIDTLWIGKLFYLLPGVYSGKHINKKEVQILRGRKVKIETDAPVVVQADGEIITSTPVELEILPGALNFVTGSR